MKQSILVLLSDSEFLLKWEQKLAVSHGVVEHHRIHY